ncbi:IS3 family transposase [Glutamicibacter endophyticus]|uniref:IS3 family transposase n=1 Tax=Glutamicibacter endophyticus TaxID=1522174 RepID=UPI003AEFD5D3
MNSYYSAKKRRPSARSVRDDQLLPKLRDVYEENFSCYGVRKMWHAMNVKHADQFGAIARCTVERLMKIAGIDGVRRKRKKSRTRSADPESCPVDLVDRQFTAAAPQSAVGC